MKNVVTYEVWFRAAFQQFTIGHICTERTKLFRRLDPDGRKRIGKGRSDVSNRDQFGYAAG